MSMCTLFFLVSFIVSIIILRFIHVVAYIFLCFNCCCILLWVHNCTISKKCKLIVYSERNQSNNCLGTDEGWGGVEEE